MMGKGEKPKKIPKNWVRDAEVISSLPDARNSKTRRHISPIGMRVVVKIRQGGNQTDSGLYLPEGTKDSMQESLLGEVLEVASAHDVDTDEEENISGVPLGALVLISKDAGIKVSWDENLRIVETADVLAIVTEVDVN